MNDTITRYSCIVDGCTWTHDQTAPGQLVPPSRDDLAAANGNYITAAAYAAARTAIEDTNAALRAHLETHDVAEFARTITHLRDELAAARRARLTDAGVDPEWSTGQVDGDGRVHWKD